VENVFGAKKAKRVFEKIKDFLVNPGADVMILEMFWQKMAFFTRNRAKLCTNMIITLFI
jgi:hypothetical protein